MNKYSEIAPSKVVSGSVHCYWLFEVPNDSTQVQHKAIPNASCSIVLIKQPYFKGIRILGPHTIKYEQNILPGSIFLGIRFHPWINFLSKPLDKQVLKNSTSDASIQLSKFLNNFLNNDLTLGFSNHEGLDNEVNLLLKKFPVTQNNMVKYICIQLSENKDISEIVATVPKSIRAIQKTFKKVTGVTMKQYASTIRERKIWEEIIIQNKDILSVILEHGFYDYAHFINDFTRKMHHSPSSFREDHGSIDISLF